MTSESMTFSSDFDRSWLRRRRTVSWFASTSSVPPATKPAISTRWNADTSSLAWIGVSIGISKYVVPQAEATAAAIAKGTTAARTLRFFFRGTRSIIDFLEELEVLPDLSVVRFEREGLFVRFASFVELTLVLIRHCKVVEGCCVGRVDLDGPFPTVDGLAPEPALR